MLNHTNSGKILCSIFCSAIKFRWRKEKLLQIFASTCLTMSKKMLRKFLGKSNLICQKIWRFQRWSKKNKKKYTTDLYAITLNARPSIWQVIPIIYRFTYSFMHTTSPTGISNCNKSILKCLKIIKMILWK